jgi:hypothetical protein
VSAGPGPLDPGGPQRCQGGLPFTLTAPFDYKDGLITWPPYTGGNISAVNDAYANYLRSCHTTEYDARCSPAAYTRER